jgi:DNA-binding GntR family transcriptional regulator
LTSTPNRGAVVATLEMSELEEMFPAMGHLEGRAGELACATSPTMSWRKFGRCTIRSFSISGAARGRVFPAQPAARNRARALAGIHRTLAIRIRHTRYLVSMTERRRAKAVEKHEEILNALCKRDGLRLAALLKTHLFNKFGAVMESLSAATSPARGAEATN